MKKKQSRDRPLTSRPAEDKSKSFQIMLNRKKVVDRERLQEVMKFQQELNILHSLQTTQDVRLSQLEASLTRYEKCLILDEKRNDDLESGSSYLGEVERLMEETKRVKAASERKLEVLQQLKKEAEVYLNTVKLEEERHRLAMETMNKKMLNHLERLRKVDNALDVNETEVQGEPTNPEAELNVHVLNVPDTPLKVPGSGHGRRCK